MRFSFSTEARKKKIKDFLKSIWTVRYTFKKVYRVDPEIIMSDQMPLHKNKSSTDKTFNFKGSSPTTGFTFVH